jgi:hypothetical protein
MPHPRRTSLLSPLRLVSSVVVVTGAAVAIVAASRAHQRSTLRYVREHLTAEYAQVWVNGYDHGAHPRRDPDTLLRRPGAKPTEERQRATDG